MKEPERLIRKYYADHCITHGSTLLFSCVRKDAWGGDGCRVEYYAAKYGKLRGERRRDVVTKHVMTFDPSTRRYWWSNSVVRYTTWSSLCISHLLFDFHREIAGSYDYQRSVGTPTGGNRMVYMGKWKKYEVMPTSEIPLNDFDGTRYKYCKYVFKHSSVTASNVHSYSYWAKNPYGSLPEYLRLFDVNPKAMEMFASRGLVGYMKEPFLVRLRDDRPFAAWYRKHAVSLVGKSICEIERAAVRDIGKTCWQIVRDEERRLERLKRKRRLEREQREEMRRKREIEEKMKHEKEERKERILNLYRRLKSICGIYGCFEVVVPKSEAEMRREGEKMHNCIGKCYPCRQGIDAIVVFLRKNGKPCVDVEVDPFTFKVVQCRLTCNRDADEQAKSVAKEVADNIKSAMKEVA